MDTHFDRLVDEFESELKSGDAPQIESYVTRFPQDSRDLVILELISLEVYYRVKRGQQVLVSDYATLGARAVAHAREALQASSSCTEAVTADFEGTQIDGRETLSGNHERFPAPFQTIGPYRLLQQIGEGGMGTVWEAEQEEPVRRRVAVKLIKSELVSKDVVARFDAEKQALAMMDHQNIARVLDAGTTKTGTPYFVMELVNGTPITQYCNDNKLSVDERLQLFVFVCRAIQHAHQKGIIHRDLKPSNVLVTIRDGRAVPKVIDFGLAKAIETELKLTERTVATEFGRLVGTVQYMSPEQTELNRIDVDTRTDVYSMGVILYEVLTGSTPLNRESLAENSLLRVLDLIREKDPPRPSDRLISSSHNVKSNISHQLRINPAKLQQILQGELDWVIMKALEKDRIRRYQTANDLAQDIANYLNGEAVQARPPSTSYRLRKFAARNRGLVASVLAICAVLIAGVAGTGYGLIRANQKASEAKTQQILAQDRAREAENERRKARANEQLAISQKNRAQKNERRAVKAEELASSESQRARDGEAAATFQLANARWEANRAFEATNLLYQIPPEYRDNFEWHFCRRYFQGSDVTCYGHTEWVYKVAFSPDGTRIASAGRDGTVRLWNSNTGEAVGALRGHQNQVGSVAFSPDGTLLASASFDKTIKLWDTQTYQEVNTLYGHSKLVASVAFSPNGKQIVSASDDMTIKVWDAESGKETITLTGHQGEIGCAVFSPDGTHIASASVDRTIGIWDLETGRATATLTGHDSFVISVAFSPDGSRLASASQDTIKLWDGRSYEEVSTLTGHTQFVHQIVFSPDGTRLASAGRDRTIRLWEVRSGQTISTLSGHTEWVNGVAFSPDGARLASASFDKTVKLWDARSGQPMAVLSGHTGTVYSLDLSHDGSVIASSGQDSTVRLWDAQSGLEVSTLSEAAMVYDVALSPDGSRIASAGQDGSVKVRDTQSTKDVATFAGHSQRVTSVAFSPNGKILASASDDHTIKLWEVTTGNEVATLKGHSAPVNSLAFSSDETKIASAGSDGAIKIWNTATLSEITTLNGRSRWLTSVVFSPDDSRLAVAANDIIRMWDTNSWEETKPLSGHTEVITSLDFNRDGSRLASASHDKTIKLWDVTTGHEMTTLRLQTDRVYSVGFSSRGDRLVSAGSDRTIKQWDARSDSEVRVLQGHSDRVTSTFFSSEGKQIYSQSANGEQYVWNVKSGLREKGAIPDPEKRHRHVSPEARWFVTAESNNVILVDLHYKKMPLEVAYRTAKARFDSGWHRQQAERAAAAENWYASTFHFSLLAKHVPEQIDLQEQLQTSYDNLLTQLRSSGNSAVHGIKPHFTSAVLEAIELLPASQ